MRTTTTHNTIPTNTAGFPPAPSEAHQRSVMQEQPPTKEEVRQWFIQLIASHAAPPTAEEIRARLWHRFATQKTERQQP